MARRAAAHPAPILWIAPDGSDSNPGTETQPLKTLTAAHTRVSAGGTIWVKPGTYASSTTVLLNKNGTAQSPIRIWAASGARPLFDFAGQPRGQSSARGIELKGDYFHIKGIDLANAGDNCVHVTGAHNTLEWLVVHGCDDTGIQISVDSSQASDATRGAYNTVLNCDSYANYDSTTGGENADGFAAKLYIGTGNVFKGCRAWNNSDDGWDLFAANDVVTIDGCWAFSNGQTPSGQSNPNGDGNGFKLGGAPAAGDANQGGAVHLVSNSFGFENLACGFVRNNNPSVPKLTANGARSNPKGDYCSVTNSGAVSMTMTSAEAIAAKRNADGSLPAIH
ncbi:MAG: right-handed parallel beta-helix repeat-containing protein [Polyangiaceae bacterium]